MREHNVHTEGTAAEKGMISNGDPPSDHIENNEGDTSLNTDASVGAVSLESEQVTYVFANNDVKGTKAYNNANVTGLYTLAMAIIEYRGHRLVAQIIIPGV